MAGKRNVVGSGTYQEAILVRWYEENRQVGLSSEAIQKSELNPAGLFKK